MKSFQQSFEQRFQDFFLAERLMQPGDSILLAVSGGVDSMAMLHLFTRLQTSWNLKLAVSHVNHQLRGAEADEDENFVRATAESKSLPFYSKRVATVDYAHTYRLSKQAAARELRYQFFEEVRQKIAADAVATAHQADDNAETVLLNAMRGTGVRGLSGIPSKRTSGQIIRPILFAYRDEIERYAKEEGIQFRHDSSNDSVHYTRNLIRHDVLPLLKANINPDVVHSLNRLAFMMRDVAKRIEAEAEIFFPLVVGHDEAGNIALNISILMKAPAYLQEETIINVFRTLGIEPEANKVMRVLELSNHSTGHSLSLSGSMNVYRDREHLVFTNAARLKSFELPVEIGKSYDLPSSRFYSTRINSAPKAYGFDKNVEFVDAAKLGSRLILRSWKEGDWFVPLGMQGKKKLSDFFTDQKVPLFEKYNIPILESDGNIVWVCGKRLDERFKVTNQTHSVIKFEYTPARPRSERKAIVQMNAEN